MKRYSAKSKILKLRAINSARSIFFNAEIIRLPKTNLAESNFNDMISEISDLVKISWGEFPKEYLIRSYKNSYILLLLRDSTEKLIGVAAVKKINIEGRVVYSFGLTAVDPDFQGLGLMRLMYSKILPSIFMENIFKLKFNLELIFITPNIRTIGSIAKIAKYVYPNPYLIDENGALNDSDEENWDIVNEFLILEKEKFRKLDKNGCVMVGFYDDKPSLIVKSSEKIPDKKLMLFAKNYLKPGNEVVVRAVINLKSLLIRSY